MEVVIVLIVALLFVGILFLAVEYGVPATIVWLAEQDKPWSPFRTLSPPGKVVMMVKASKDGPFHSVLPTTIPEWGYNETTRQFEPGTQPPHVGPLAKLGVVNVGFFKKYYRRRRRYDTYELKPGSSEYAVVRTETKPGEEHLFYFATTMAIELVNIPTSENYPASITLVFNVLMIHPEKAEFLAGKSDVQAVAAVTARARAYISAKSVKDLRDERDTPGREDMVDFILKANEDENQTVGLKNGRGLEIQGLFYTGFDLESGNKEMNEAMRRNAIAVEDVKTATTRAEETRIKAEAESNRRKIEAEGIRAEFAARGSVPDGGMISMAEAIKEAKPQVIGGSGIVNLK